MSFQAMSKAMAIDTGDALSKLLLLTLANCADEDGKVAHVSQRELAARSSIKKRTLQRKLIELEKLKLIETVTVDGWQNQYSIKFLTP